MSLPGTHAGANAVLASWRGRAWWAIVLRGLALVALGLVALIWPVATATAFYLMLGIFLVLDGMLNVTAGVFAPGVPGRGWTIGFGFLAVVLGVAALVWPRAGATVLYSLLVIWALLAGIVGVISAWSRRAFGLEWGWTMAWGVAVIAFAVLLMFSDPLVGLWTVTTVFNIILGVFAIVAGGLLTVAGVRAKPH